MNQRFENLVEKAKPSYSNGDPAHSFAHIKRVMLLCEKLAKEEEVEKEVLLAGALLHDVVNLPKNHPRRSEASAMAAEKARRLLEEVGYDEEFISKALVVVYEHSFSLGKKPSCLESAILQDADRLDALGAIGLMRMISCGVGFKAEFYNEEDPFAKERSLDDKRFSLDHFYTKLFKLPELMNTSAGKAEANERVHFMKSFVKQLRAEIE
ncbi:MAG: hypothetical protein ACJAT2_002575 [Bacteriovoracaceae bacterium]|jgi:uncharacterized protein